MVEEERWRLRRKTKEGSKGELRMIGTIV